jgi:hypothetical protein
MASTINNQQLSQLMREPCRVRAAPANDLPAQRTFVHRVFGLAA